MTSQTTEKKTQTGKVVSNRMNKTIVVSVERLVKHPKYGKITRKSTKLYAHDEKQVANIGDIVSVKEIKPLSKLKNWELVEVIS